MLWQEVHQAVAAEVHRQADVLKVWGVTLFGTVGGNLAGAWFAIKGELPAIIQVLTIVSIAVAIGYTGAKWRRLPPVGLRPKTDNKAGEPPVESGASFRDPDSSL